MTFDYNFISKSIVYNICELDSSIMNLGVAKVNEYDDSVNPLEFINHLQSKNISLVYLKSKVEHNNFKKKLQYFPSVKYMAQNIKYAIQLTRNNDTLTNNNPSDIIGYNYEIPINHLERLAGACNKYSHLRKDPLIQKKHVDKLYFQWLHKSIIDKNNGGILITSINDKIIGMLVYSKKFHSINVDLISVEKKMRRQKYGRKLMEALLFFAKNSGVTTITVETQTTNIPANKLYESFGFKILYKQNIFHCWL